MLLKSGVDFKKALEILGQQSTHKLERDIILKIKSEVIEGKSIGSNVIENILSIYSDLNPIWLLTGTGTMFKEDEEFFQLNCTNQPRMLLEQRPAGDLAAELLEPPAQRTTAPRRIAPDIVQLDHRAANRQPHAHAVGLGGEERRAQGGHGLSIQAGTAVDHRQANER